MKNLTKMFEMQKALDAKIIEEKGLQDMDRLPYLILALQVELGECANEWRGFKYWSKDQKPRTLKIHQDRDAYLETNPLLEEYVDCLHFILSIGLHLDIDDSVYQNLDDDELTGTIEAFQHAFNWIVNLEYYRKISVAGTRKCYESLVCVFITLGEFLGFSWEQIENAYMDKNAVNHKRQSNGY